MYKIDTNPEILLKNLKETKPEIYKHSVRVETVVKSLAEYLGINEIYKEELIIAAKYHDVGKLICDDKNHPKLSSIILQEFGFSGTIRNFIREHHERLDGSGFPKGIEENEISYYSQILGIVDEFDNLIYNQQFSFKEAKDELKKFPEKYNTEILKGFENLLGEIEKYNGFY